MDLFIVVYLLQKKRLESKKKNFFARVIQISKGEYIQMSYLWNNRKIFLDDFLSYFLSLAFFCWFLCCGERFAWPAQFWPLPSKMVFSRCTWITKWTSKRTHDNAGYTKSENFTLYFLSGNKPTGCFPPEIPRNFKIARNLLTFLKLFSSQFEL